MDEFSRYTRFCSLKNKGHVFEKFKEFKTLAEKQCDLPMKYIRLDNGVEYVSKEFQIYLSHNGIS
jgi:hypothetical protein